MIYNRGDVIALMYIFSMKGAGLWEGKGTSQSAVINGSKLVDKTTTNNPLLIV